MVPPTWSPSPSDYLEALANQNPWQQLGRVPESLALPVRRALPSRLWERLLTDGPRRYQIVLGPRRVGKTVGMHQTIQALIEAGVAPDRLWFLKLDHPLLMSEDLGGWASELLRRQSAGPGDPLYLFLDEINYSPHWDRWLKTFYDEQWPLRIVATSSSTAALRDRTVESGIGRWSVQYLMPYSFVEYIELRRLSSPDFETADDLFQTLRSVIAAPLPERRLAEARSPYLLIGGFPELLLGGSPEEPIEAAVVRSQHVLRAEAVQRVAGIDIPQVFDIKHPQILERMVYVLAGQMCGLVNISSLSGALDISRPTALQYLNYLEKAFLVFSLPNFSTSEETVQRQGRKIYFVDGAVRNAALQRGLAPIHDPSEIGYLVENSAASHLFGLSLHTGMRLFHWRTGGKEVDFVYDDVGGPIAFEVTTSAKHALEGMRALHRRYPQFVGRSFLVSSQEQAPRLPEDDDQGVGRISFEQMLLAVGAVTARALSRKLQLV